MALKVKSEIEKCAEYRNLSRNWGKMKIESKVWNLRQKLKFRSIIVKYWLKLEIRENFCENWPILKIETVIVNKKT